MLTQDQKKKLLKNIIKYCIKPTTESKHQIIKTENIVKAINEFSLNLQKDKTIKFKKDDVQLLIQSVNQNHLLLDQYKQTLIKKVQALNFQETKQVQKFHIYVSKNKPLLHGADFAIVYAESFKEAWDKFFKEYPEHEITDCVRIM